MEALVHLLIRMDLGSVPVSDADVVLRQLVVSVGGITGGAALLYAFITVRWKVPGAWTIARMLVSMCILAWLTTEHIYSHLLGNDAPLWQLWSALIGFALGAESLVRRIKQGRATVVEPEPVE